MHCNPADSETTRHYIIPPRTLRHDNSATRGELTPTYRTFSTDSGKSGASPPPKGQSYNSRKPELDQTHKIDHSIKDEMPNSKVSPRASEPTVGEEELTFYDLRTNY